jgi:hypothetical protein
MGRFASYGVSKYRPLEELGFINYVIFVEEILSLVIHKMFFESVLKSLLNLKCNN